MPEHKRRLLLRFIKEGNEHYKNHRGGTSLAIISVLGGWVVTWLGLQIPPWIGVAGIVVLVIALAAISAWYAATQKNIAYEDRLKPKIHTDCGPNVLGSKPPLNRSVQALRIAVTSLSDAPIHNCEAHLVAIDKDNKPLWAGNKAALTFAPAETHGSRPKTIYPQTQDFVDVIYICEEGPRCSLGPGTDRGLWNYGCAFDTLLTDHGVYFLTVQIVGDMPPETVRLRFTWTGNVKTSKLEKISDSDGQTAVSKQRLAHSGGGTTRTAA